MTAVCDAQAFAEAAKRMTCLGELTGLLDEVARELGFDCVTLMHHPRRAAPGQPLIAFSTYPESFVAMALERRYVADDPVLVACERRVAPFDWSEAPRLVAMTERRREILEAAAASGLRRGLTIPIHAPGEPPGSCSFAVLGDRELPAGARQAAHWVGAFAFEQARRMLGLGVGAHGRPRLSPRQLDCLVWAGRGKSDAAIAVILGLSPETVREHMAAARARYGVATRQQLMSACLQDGQLTFADLMGRD